MHHRSALASGLVWLICTATVASSREQTVSDYYRPEMWRRIIVVSRDEFTPDRLERRFRQFLLLGEGASSIVQLQVFVDQSDVWDNRQYFTDMNYRMWRMLFEDYVKRFAPVAQLTIIGRSASMRIRDLAGRVHSKVLQGDDPLRVVTHDCIAEVIHIHPDVFRRPGEPRLENQPDLTFYLRAEQKLSRGCAESIARSLHRRVKVDRIKARIRPDTWFIADGFFPIVYPFQEKLDPPSAEEDQKVLQIGCLARSDSAAVRCWGGEAQK